VSGEDTPRRVERVLPAPEDFDPDAFGEEEGRIALAEGVRLFDSGAYHAAHEAFERCWLANEGGDADFFKGLVQASICLHHLERGNLEGARKLYAGQRRLLGAYLPSHRGLDVAALLEEMRRVLQPVLRGARPDPTGPRPRIGALDPPPEPS